MIGEGEYISRNSLGLGTAMPRLTDDELANALTLDRMASYAKGGAHPVLADRRPSDINNRPQPRLFPLISSAAVSSHLRRA